MTTKPFLHELPETPVLIEQIARNRMTRSQLVEKDYWLMHALWGLQQQKFEFELKGVTPFPRASRSSIDFQRTST